MISKKNNQFLKVKNARFKFRKMQHPKNSLLTYVTIKKRNNYLLQLARGHISVPLKPL